MIEIMERLRALQERVAQLERQEQQSADTQALGNAVSMFLSLPGLVAFYPGNAGEDTSGNYVMWDHSPNVKHLTRSGWQQAGGSLYPYIEFAGGSDVAYVADDDMFDMVGNEAYVASGNTGFTIGGWFYMGAAAGSTEIFISKGTGSTAHNYYLDRSAAGAAIFTLSNGGTAYTVTGGTLAQSTWYFVVGRFRPSTSVDVLVNNTETRNTTSIPATATTNNEPFAIGARSDGGGGYADYFTGYASMCFVCQSKLPDTLLTALYRATAPLFL